MPITPVPQDRLTQRIAALEAQVAELARAVGRGSDTIRDPAGNIIFTASTVTGIGLGKPYLPVTFTAYDSTQWTGTTGGATILATATFYKQHSHIVVPVWTIGTVPGTTGTIQLQIGGTPVGTPVALTDTVALTTLGPAQLPGAHLDQVSVNVLAGRTGGAGTFAIQIGQAYSMAP